MLQTLREGTGTVVEKSLRVGWPIFGPMLAILGGFLRELPQRRAAKRIVLFQVGGIGDHIFCMPLLEELKRLHPTARITLITAQHEDLIKSWNVLIDDEIHVGGEFYRFLELYKGQPIRLALGVSPMLLLRVLRQRFDIGLALGPGASLANYAACLLWLGGVKERFGSFYVSDDFERFLSMPYAGKKGPSTPVPNLRTMYLRTLPQAYSRLDIGETWRANIRGDQSWSRQLFQQIPFEQRGPKVIIHPGAKTYVNVKRWPLEKYREVANRLVEEYEATVFLTGGKDEVALCEAVRGGNSSKIHNLAGRTSVSQLIGLLSQADLVITNDTSTLHLADAAGAKRIIAIFGPTDPKRAAPMSDVCRVVTLGLTCSPCMEFDASNPDQRCTNEKLYECVNGLPVETVWAAVEEALQQLSANRKQCEGAPVIS